MSKDTILPFTRLLALQVSWRRYPCCCPPCMVQLWENCQAKQLAGPMEIVVQPGERICTARETGECGREVIVLGTTKK